MRRRHLHKCRRQNQLAHGREIIFLVGRDAKAAVRHEQPVHQGQEIGAHDAPAPMLFLRPRIGEKQMHHVDRSGREQILNGVGALDAQDADVRQRQAGRFLAGPPHPAGQFLEAKKIPFWKSLGQRRRERPRRHIRYRPRAAPGVKKPASDRAARNSSPESILFRL